MPCERQCFQPDLLARPPELLDLLLLLVPLELTHLLLHSLPGLELGPGHLGDGRLLPRGTDLAEVHVVAVRAAGFV